MQRNSRRSVCPWNPVYEFVSIGHPEWVGISHGWAVDKFFENSKVTLPSGRVYENLCIGCDAFHREVLMCCKTQLVSISATQPSSTTEKRLSVPI